MVKVLDPEERRNGQWPTAGGRKIGPWYLVCSGEGSSIPTYPWNALKQTATMYDVAFSGSEWAGHYCIYHTVVFRGSSSRKRGVPGVFYTNLHVVIFHWPLNEERLWLKQSTVAIHVFRPYTMPPKMSNNTEETDNDMSWNWYHLHTWNTVLSVLFTEGICFGVKSGYLHEAWCIKLHWQ